MNKILFSERLVARRKECGYSTQHALAKEYNKRFPSHRKNRKEENAENASGILGTIKNYENINHDGSPKLDIVCNLCEILECDVDYLLGAIECKNHDAQFVCDYTGLSETAINALHMLHTPADPSIVDSLQVGRYDTIALNYILEEFYDGEKNKECHQKFSTDTILNLIGRYIDANSARFEKMTPDFRQNGNTFIFSPEKVAKEIFKTDLYDLLEGLRKKYSLAIITSRNEHNKYFENYNRENCKPD